MMSYRCPLCLGEIRDNPHFVWVFPVARSYGCGMRMALAAFADDPRVSGLLVPATPVAGLR